MIWQVVGKKTIVMAYNKRVKGKSFEEGKIVCRVMLSLSSHMPGFGKWSPTWEGPYGIYKILGNRPNLLKDKDGKIHQDPINGKWLKKFYLILWDAKGIDLTP